MAYKEVKNTLPPKNTPLKTKISDEKGERNEAVLIKQGGLWWTSDMKMYVYYTPTHWDYTD